MVQLLEKGVWSSKQTSQEKVLFLWVYSTTQLDCCYQRAHRSRGSWNFKQKLPISLNILIFWNSRRFCHLRNREPYSGSLCGYKWGLVLFSNSSLSLQTMVREREEGSCSMGTPPAGIQTASMAMTSTPEGFIQSTWLVKCINLFLEGI